MISSIKRRARVIETSSDHRAVLGIFKKIGKRDYYIVTWNLAPGKTLQKKRDLARLCAIADILLLQETYGHDLESLLPEGWHFHEASRTAVAWRPTTEKITRQIHSLSDRQYIGPGVGPSTAYKKEIPTVIFGEELTVGSVHLTASSHMPIRRTLVKKQIQSIVDWSPKRNVVLGGDFNMIPSNPLLNPLRKLGYTVLRSKRTGKARQIDHLWYK